VSTFRRACDATNLPNRRGERRRADFRPHLVDLLEHLVEAIACVARTQLHVERGHNADRQLPLGRSHGYARRDGRDGLVPDVLVDEVGSIPELVEVDSGRESSPASACRRGLRRHTVHRQRDRVDGDGDHVGTGACRLERRGERVATRALGVEADWQARDVAQLGHELARTVRLENGGRIVQEDARCPQLRQALRSVDECLVAAAA